MFTLKDLDLDYKEVENRITSQLRSYVEKSGLKGGVVAVSGGVDSSVTLSLSVKALGPSRVTALTMPEKDVTPERDIRDVISLCEGLGVTCNLVDITDMFHVMQGSIGLKGDRVALGNLKARIRMVVSYFYANTESKLVIGTSNKTELLTGFFTKFGDGACDVAPLGDLYKYNVRQLGRHLGLPPELVEKTPSPGFYKGQTDEGELGCSYDHIDLMLYSWERGYTAGEIAEGLGLDPGLVRRILRRVEENEHKRRLPYIVKVSKR